jgi:hypothetical protein
MPGNIGDFKELVKNSNGLFVDKSLFIQEIIDSQTDPLLITRPRRWGKTINMNMLFYFFVHGEQLIGMGKSTEFIKQCNDLFVELNIFKTNANSELAKIYMRQYPVIFTSFALSGDDSSKTPATPDWNKIKGLIIGRIAKLFSEFNYLAENLKKVVDKKFNQEFNLALDQKIAEYKKQFNVENIPDAAQIRIYEQVQIDKSVYPEQQELEKFYRLSRGKPEGDAELSDSINFLAQLLCKFHNKPVYILVDEYDSLINKYFDHQEILNELTKTFSGIFSAFAKPVGMMNDHIQKVMFTGILRVAKANIFSGLNNLQECTVLDERFSKYYGFTPDELGVLLKKANKIESIKEVEDWYNGYKMGVETIYNPWSVMQFINTGKLFPHWVDTANREIIRDIVLNNKGHAINKLLRDIIKNGIDGATVSVNAKKSVSVEDLKNPKSIWSFLIHTGYLTVTAFKFDEEFGAFNCDVKIPNVEVKTIYNSIIRDWLQEVAAIQRAITNLFDKNYEAFADNLQQMLEKRYDSALFARGGDSVEEVYHSLLLAELNKDTSVERYALLPEECTGDGRADILFIDKTNKIFIPIELKRTTSGTECSLKKGAEEAVNQAINERYGDDEKYKLYTKRPAVGINFHGMDIALMVEGMEEKDIIVRKMKRKHDISNAVSVKKSKAEKKDSPVPGEPVASQHTGLYFSPQKTDVYDIDDSDEVKPEATSSKEPGCATPSPPIS